MAAELCRLTMPELSSLEPAAVAAAVSMLPAEFEIPDGVVFDLKKDYLNISSMVSSLKLTENAICDAFRQVGLFPRIVGSKLFFQPNASHDCIASGIGIQLEMWSVSSARFRSQGAKRFVDSYYLHSGLASGLPVEALLSSTVPKCGFPPCLLLPIESRACVSI
jgi:hypothetical protein